MKWKQYKNTKYFISNYGLVKSKDKILKSAICNSGYFRVHLSIKGVAKHFSIHRLVALLFIKNNENLPIVNHKDGNKLNNYYKNLQWANYSYNLKHAFFNNLRNAKGSNNPSSRLNEKDILRIRKLYATKKYTHLKLSKIYNVHKDWIYCILKRKVWKHI